jgi:transcriptional regulator of acetoin/glycerol metabolism
MDLSLAQQAHMNRYLKLLMWNHLLDEVGELPLTTWDSIVAVLNGEFIKVGSSQVQKTNVRIVAAIT